MYANYIPSAASGFADCQLKTSEGSSGESTCCKYKTLMTNNSNSCPTDLSFLLQLASCLIYARALLEYVIFILLLRSVNKMLPSVKFVEDKMLTFLILREKC